MNLKTTLAALVGVALLGVSAMASVTISPRLNTGKDQNGVVLTSGTCLMVLDADNDGWNGNSYLTQSPGTNNSASWQWDSSDTILQRLTITTAGKAYTNFSADPTTIPGYTAGVDHVYLLWFLTPYDVNATGPGQGVYYGAADCGVVPNDGGTLSYTASGNATLTTVPVPEPASMTLLGLGLGGLLLRRRLRGNV